MGFDIGRRLCAKAKVRLLLAIALGLLSARSAWAQERLVLTETEREPGVVVYAARRAGHRGVTVFLHGMCGEPASACDRFAEQVTKEEHLICPRASQRCDGGGSTWPQRGFEAQIEQAVRRGIAELGGVVDEARGRTLIGYSLGAFRALALAEHGAGQYPRVMLIGAKVLPSQRKLRENGVERLLLSAGSRDMMHDHMRREAERLARGGFMARFVEFGQAGHAFEPSLDQYLPEALLWLRAAE